MYLMVAVEPGQTKLPVFAVQVMVVNRCMCIISTVLWCRVINTHMEVNRCSMNLPR